MWTIDVELIADWLDNLEPDHLIDVVVALELIAEHGPDQSGVAGQRNRGIDHWGILVDTSVWPMSEIHFVADDSSVIVFSGTGDALSQVRRGPSYRKQFRELMATKSIEGLSLSEFIATCGIDVGALADRKLAKVIQRGRRCLADLRAAADIDLDGMARILSEEYPSPSFVDHIEHEGIDCESVETLRKYVHACGARLRVQVEVDGEWVAIA